MARQLSRILRRVERLFRRPRRGRGNHGTPAQPGAGGVRRARHRLARALRGARPPGPARALRGGRPGRPGGDGRGIQGQDAALNRYVAIKALAPQWASDQPRGGDSPARPRRPRPSATRTSSPSTPSASGAAALPGHGVRHRVIAPAADRRRGPLELKEILRIGMQVASGLAAAHAQGLIHRDIKPSNIMLENGWSGSRSPTSAWHAPSTTRSLTQHGTLVGTPPYMAPEQARGEPMDHRSDLFSLGSVLYAMATGLAAFRGESSVEVIRRVSDGEPAPVRELNPEALDWLAEIIERLHAKAARRPVPVGRRGGRPARTPPGPASGPVAAPGRTPVATAAVPPRRDRPRDGAAGRRGAARDPAACCWRWPPAPRPGPGGPCRSRPPRPTRRRRCPTGSRRPGNTAATSATADTTTDGCTSSRTGRSPPWPSPIDAGSGSQSRPGRTAGASGPSRSSASTATSRSPPRLRS